jgi:hypothetical protein
LRSKFVQDSSDSSEETKLVAVCKAGDVQNNISKWIASCEFFSIKRETKPQKETSEPVRTCKVIKITEKVFNEFVTECQDIKNWTTTFNTKVPTMAFITFLERKFGLEDSDSSNSSDSESEENELRSKFNAECKKMKKQVNKWIAESSCKFILVGSRVNIDLLKMSGTVEEKTDKEITVKLDEKVDGSDTYTFEPEQLKYLELLEPNKPTRRRLISRLA